MNEETKHGLGVALNEATLLGAEVDRTRRLAAITFSVLTLPPGDGPVDADPRVSMILHPVGRVAASLHHGRWDDRKARVEPFRREDLLSVVHSFKRQPVYGWQFIDVAGDFEKWSDRLSLDESFGEDGRTHTISLFQESVMGDERHLDFQIWFDRLQIVSPAYEPIAMEAFIEGGKRWWDGLHAGDPRTQAPGIIPGGPDDLPSDFWKKLT